MRFYKNFLKRRNNMKKQFKAISLLLVVAIALSLLAACGSGTGQSGPKTSSASDTKVYTFKIDYPNSENSAVYPVLVKWAEYISEKSNGRLKATIYANGALGKLPDCVNNCIGGVTDGFWSGVTIYPGVFPATEVFGLPYMGANNQEVVTAAMNKMLKETNYLTKEWSNLKVIALHSATASPILFSAQKQIKSAADMAGLKLRISNAYTTTWMKNLGVNPVSVGINDGYEYMEKNIIDGGLFFFDQLQSSALYEQIDYLLTANAIYPLTMFCMNKDVYNKLPDDLKKIIDESGDWFLKQVPGVHNEQVKNMLAKCQEHKVTVAAPDSAFSAELTAAAKPAWQQWIDTMKSKGYDGQAIFDTAVKYIKEFNEVYKG